MLYWQADDLLLGRVRPTITFIIFFVVILAVIFSIPSFLYKEDSSNWYLNNKVNLGLDLQGGSYLLLEVDSSPIINQNLQQKIINLRKYLKKDKIKYKNLKLENQSINFELFSNDITKF